MKSVGIYLLLFLLQLVFIDVSWAFGWKRPAPQKSHFQPSATWGEEEPQRQPVRRQAAVAPVRPAVMAPAEEQDAELPVAPPERRETERRPAAATERAPSCQLPPGFVYLKDEAPDIHQDMKYATQGNFVGRVLNGYSPDGNQNACVLHKSVAEALKKAQAELKKKSPHLSLMVYDCYRPTQAQDQMRQRVQNGSYVAQGVSKHSRGIAVDVTIIDTRKGRQSLNMGSAFDTFGRAAHYSGDGHDHSHDPLLAATPSAHQRLLRDVITRSHRCMKPYSKEWWHFSYQGSGCGETPQASNLAIPSYRQCGQVARSEQTRTRQPATAVRR